MSVYLAPSGQLGARNGNAVLSARRRRYTVLACSLDGHNRLSKETHFVRRVSIDSKRNDGLFDALYIDKERCWDESAWGSSDDFRVPSGGGHLTRVADVLYATAGMGYSCKDVRMVYHDALVGTIKCSAVQNVAVKETTRSDGSQGQAESGVPRPSSPRRRNAIPRPFSSSLSLAWSVQDDAVPGLGTPMEGKLHPLILTRDRSTV